MKKLILILLAGCSMQTPPKDYYTKEEIDAGINRIVSPILSDLVVIKEKLFPEAVKVSEKNNNCQVNVKTMKCINE